MRNSDQISYFPYTQNKHFGTKVIWRLSNCVLCLKSRSPCMRGSRKGGGQRGTDPPLQFNIQISLNYFIKLPKICLGPQWQTQITVGPPLETFFWIRACLCKKKVGFNLLVFIDAWPRFKLNIKHQISLKFSDMICLAILDFVPCVHGLTLYIYDIGHL